MAVTIHPDRTPPPVPDSEPLAVIKLAVDFPDAYRAGHSKFTVACLLNRPPTPHERRLFELPTFQLDDNGHLATTRHVHLERRDLEGFTVDDVDAALRDISAHAAEQQRDAEVEMGSIRESIRVLNLDLSED